MELMPIVEKTVETIKSVGRFVLHRIDGAHGGFAELADVVKGEKDVQ